MALPSPRAFFAFLITERLSTTISKPGTGYTGLGRTSPLRMTGVLSVPLNDLWICTFTFTDLWEGRAEKWRELQLNLVPRVFCAAAMLNRWQRPWGRGWLESTLARKEPWEHLAITTRLYGQHLNPWHNLQTKEFLVALKGVFGITRQETSPPFYRGKPHRRLRSRQLGVVKELSISRGKEKSSSCRVSRASRTPLSAPQNAAYAGHRRRITRLS